MAMTVRDLVGSLPHGALRVIIDWLELQDRVDDTRGWRKDDFITSVCSKVSRADAEALHAKFNHQPPYFPVGLLASVFGHLSKEVMLRRLRQRELREIMQTLENEQRVAIYWRSLSTDSLRGYLIQKLGVDEIARLVGLAPATPSSRSKNPVSYRPGKIIDPFGGAGTHVTVSHHSRATSPSPPAVSAIESPILVDASTPRSPNDTAAHAIEKLEDLHRYLVDGLQRDLETLEDLGSNEQRFQHHIVRTLESRLSRDPFRLEEKWYLAETGQFPDIAIIHARGHVFFEVKPKGALDDLLLDAAKLRGYLRNKKANVTFGVLIYRSPREIPAELSRAMRGENLHLVRVRSSKRS